MTDIDKLLEKAEGSKAEITEQLNKLAGECEEKLGIPATTVLDKYESEYNRLDGVLKTDDPNTIARRAWIIVKGLYKGELRSTALMFEGVFLGVTEPFDMVRTARKQAIEMYQTDQEQAVADGFCDVDGTPLDNKAEFGNGNANPNFGKPLPEYNRVRNAVGMVNHEGEMKLFAMSLGERLVNLVVPTMEPVRFRANPARNQNTPGILTLNPYSKISFDILDEDIEAMLQENLGLYDQYRMKLDEIQDYHAQVAKDYRRFSIVEADIMYIDGVPNPKTGNKMVNLADESLSEEHPGITAWLPGHIPIDFGAGSRVILCGQTMETNYNVEEGNNFILNITGVFAIPELKVPADEVPHDAVRKVS